MHRMAQHFSQPRETIGEVESAVQVYQRERLGVMLRVVRRKLIGYQFG